MYRKNLPLQTENLIWLLDSAKDMLSSWGSANQFPLRILEVLSWNICHRRWSLRGRQRLPDFCYHGAKTRHSAWALAWWSCWRRSLRPRTTHSHKARWIRSVNPIQQSSCFADPQQFWFSSASSRLSWNFATYYFGYAPANPLLYTSNCISLIPDL